MHSGVFKTSSKRPLLRIDDRLIHGQVIVGWGEQLSFRRMVLAHDASVNDEAVRSLYDSIIPPEIEGEVKTLDQTLEFFRNEISGKKTMVITESSRDALYLLKSGLEVEAVVVGGLHFRAGAIELLSYVFIDRQRKEELLEIVRTNVKIFCQDLPGSPVLTLNEKNLNLEF